MTVKEMRQMLDFLTEKGVGVELKPCNIPICNTCPAKDKCNDAIKHSAIGTKVLCTQAMQSAMEFAKEHMEVEE